MLKRKERGLRKQVTSSWNDFAINKNNNNKKKKKTFVNRNL